MKDKLAIPDVFLKEMDLFSAGVVLDESDNLLRRFGRCDLVTLFGDIRGVEFYRRKADEYWAIFGGEASMELEDFREDSPSQGEKVTLQLGAHQEVGVLVPFGVICRVFGSASFIRLMTHSPDLEAGDRFQFLK